VRYLLAAAVTASLVGSGASASPSPTRIVFAANRAPQYFGEIYRVGPSGQRVDLSRSPARDYAPAISTSGKKVAFVSRRGGRVAVYVTGTNGGKVTRVSPLLFPSAPNTDYMASLSWSPDDRVLAAWFGDYGHAARLYLAGPGNGWRSVTDHADPLTAGATWSADGRFLAFATYVRGVHVITRDGRAVWTAPGTRAAWSARGRLSVQQNSTTVHVYDEAGRSLATFAGAFPAWSPNGETLASLSASGRLELRAGGVGTPTLDVLAAPKPSLVTWLGARVVRLDTERGEVGYDTVSRRRVALAKGYQGWNVPYVDGTRTIAYVFGASTDRLEVATQQGAVRTIATAPSCGDVGAFADFQFAPGGRSVVYDTSCPAPSADIYSVGLDGKQLRRLTKLPADETQPALSPDGTRLAYVSKPNAAHCPGCSEQLMLASSTGANPERVAPAPSADDTQYDDSPSWSPDGAHVVFARSGPNSTGLFNADPATHTAESLGIAGELPVWGPTRIAYRSWPSGRLVTAAPDGTDVRPVAGAGDALSFAWSPSGILALLNSRGSTLWISIGARKLALPGLSATVPAGGLAWSPDGGQLAFTATDGEGVSDLYTVHADGSHRTRITHGLGVVSSVSWR
jgi:Tol biopolymer transport system component